LGGRNPVTSYTGTVTRLTDSANADITTGWAKWHTISTSTVGKKEIEARAREAGITRGSIAGDTGGVTCITAIIPGILILVSIARGDTCRISAIKKGSIDARGTVRGRSVRIIFTRLAAQLDCTHFTFS
jgi:hypothetical protein